MNSAKKSATKSALPTPSTAAALPPPDDLHLVVEKLAELAGANNRLAQLQQAIDLMLFTAAKSFEKEHTDLSRLTATVEAEIEALVRRHPEWFADRKSLPSPYGTVKLTSSTRLEAADEELSLVLLARHLPLTADAYVRTLTTLNLEALAALDDSDLKKLRIERVTEDKFSITPAKVNLGKTIKALAKAGEGAK